MRVVLIGADFEENLGVGMIAAVAEAAGHRVEIEPFNSADDAKRIARSVVSTAPDVVGLSMQFQHRSHEFLSLARALRQGGYAGHITAGGQFPTLAFREVLGRGHGVDTVVLHDGEETFVELLAALEQGTPTYDVPGLAVSVDGTIVRTAGRGLRSDLDALPFPKRYRPPSRHAGVPFVPIMGARGCWGSCSYCSITSFYRDAKAHGGGPRCACAARRASPKRWLSSPTPLGGPPCSASTTTISCCPAPPTRSSACARSRPSSKRSAWTRSA